MDIKHTPTPWHVGDKGSFPRAEHFIYAENGWQIAQCNEHRPLTEENAAFIVRACNAHDELVKVLRDFIIAYDGQHVELNSPELDGQEDIPPHPWHEEWLYLVRAALAKADGK